LFEIDIAPRWAGPILEVLSSTGIWTQQDAQIMLAKIQKSGKYTLISGRLYGKGINNVLKLCVELEEHYEILSDASHKPRRDSCSRTPDGANNIAKWVLVAYNECGCGELHC